MDPLTLAKRPDLVIVTKKMRTCLQVYFIVPANQKVKLKETEKKDKYLDLARELKETVERESDSDINCNWRDGIVTKGLAQGQEQLEIRGRVETIQTAAFLRSARIPRRVLELAVAQTPARNHR